MLEDYRIRVPAEPLVGFEKMHLMLCAFQRPESPYPSAPAANDGYPLAIVHGNLDNQLFRKIGFLKI